MEDLNLLTTRLKSDIEGSNFRNIIKLKLKTISKNNLREKSNSIQQYNYYVQLSKKIKRTISNQNDYIYKAFKDNIGNIICLIVTMDLEQVDIGVSIEIKAITGDNNEAFMKCTYFSSKQEGILFIDNFQSKNSRSGLGKMLLSNLDYIVGEINKKLNCINTIQNSNNYNLITRIEGISIPTKNIISQEALNSLYIRYGFNVNTKDKMKIVKYI